MKKKVSKSRERSNAKDRVEAYKELVRGDFEFSTRLTLIQQLIPLGLMAVEEILQEEVTQLAGEPYSRGGSRQRWGSNPGSIYLSDQKVAIEVPRVRDKANNQEVPLVGYHQLQCPRVINDLLLSRVLNGISTRKYEKAAERIPETFGISKSSVSRKFIEGSAKQLKQLNERDLSQEDIAAIFIDGKCFAEQEIIIALGVRLDGVKVILGMIESGTENHQVCRDFLQQLKTRGLASQHPILFIIDGSKGLSKGIKKEFGQQAFIQRCQYHKRENVVAYLPKSQQSAFRQKLQKAYNRVAYKDAKRALNGVRKELKLINLSAVNSLQEGLEETLTLHRLGLAEKLSVSFRTTNCIESLNRQLEIFTGRVSYWQNSKQRQRWVATALLEIEGNLRRVKGYKHLVQLKEAMTNVNQMKKKAA